MPRVVRRARALAAAAAVVACAADPVLVEHESGWERGYLIAGVAVFDGEALRPNQNVLVRDGAIERVSELPLEPGQCTLVDGRGKTLVPGLIDMHAHLFATDSPPWQPARPRLGLRAQQFLYSGVTTVFALSAKRQELEARDERISKGLPTPRFVPAYGPLTARGGHPLAYLEAALPWPLDWLVTRDIATAESTDDARIWVRRTVEEHRPAFLKLVYEDIPYGGPRLGREVLEAAIDEARSLGVGVIVHVGDARGAVEAAEAGAVALAHTPNREELTDEEVGRIERTGVSVFSTVGMFRAQRDQEQAKTSELESESVSPDVIGSYRRRPNGWKLEMGEFEIDEVFVRSYRNASTNVVKLQRAGVRVFPATDSGIPGVFPGSGLHREIRLLRELGIPSEYLLEMSTRRAAEFLGLGGEIGAVKEGYEASVLLVDGNPLENVAAISRIRDVFHRGKRIARHPLGP